MNNTDISFFSDIVVIFRTSKLFFRHYFKYEKMIFEMKFWVVGFILQAYIKNITEQHSF